MMYQSRGLRVQGDSVAVEGVIVAARRGMPLGVGHGQFEVGDPLPAITASERRRGRWQGGGGKDPGVDRPSRIALGHYDDPARRPEVVFQQREVQPQHSGRPEPLRDPVVGDMPTARSGRSR